MVHEWFELALSKWLSWDAISDHRHTLALLVLILLIGVREAEGEVHFYYPLARESKLLAKNYPR